MEICRKVNSGDQPEEETLLECRHSKQSGKLYRKLTVFSENQMVWETSVWKVKKKPASNICPTTLSQFRVKLSQYK
jgi:hypothetical protein